MKNAQSSQVNLCPWALLINKLATGWGGKISNVQVGSSNKNEVTEGVDDDEWDD